MRYLLLVLLSSPIVAVALLNTITKYKLGQIDKNKLVKQGSFWILLLIVLFVALPIYNYLNHSSIFASDSLTILDILQTTAIVYLMYLVNVLRQKIDKSEKRLRDLHQELSIKLSTKK